MESLSETAARILEIEARQDDALRQLAELEQRLDAVLAQYIPAAKSAKRSEQPSEPVAISAPAEPPVLAADSVLVAEQAKPKAGRPKRSMPAVKAA